MRRMESTREEEENFVRVKKVLYGVAPRAIRETFHKYFPPTKWPAILRTEESWLKRQKRLSDKQISILFPSSGTISSKNYDLTLMIHLLRNLTDIKPPLKGFDKLPSGSERNDGADLARIKYYRNYYAHYETDKISKTDFLYDWKEITEAIVRLGGTSYNSDIDAIKSSELSAEYFVHFQEDLETTREELRDQIKISTQSTVDFVQGNLDKISRDFLDETEEIQEKIQTVATRCSCYDAHELLLKEWEIEDRRFVTTDAVGIITKHLKFHYGMLVFGKPGIGKSSTIHHIALGLRDEEGYAIIPCVGPSDIKIHYKKNVKQLFLIDDICGRHCLNQNDVEEWFKENNCIELILNQDNVRILLSCRLQIYFEKQFKRLKLLKKYTCYLSSENYSLSFEIRKKIARKYLAENIVKAIGPYINNSEFSPLLCKLAENKKDKNDVLNLFMKPYEYYKSNIEDLSKEPNKCKYTALFLFICSNGYIDTSYLTLRKVDLVLTQFDNCGTLSRTRIKEELDSLSQTYLFKPKIDTYTKIHNRQFEYLCFYFGETRQIELIWFADVIIIRDRMYLKCSDIKMDEFCIKIKEENEDEYIFRLFTDWFNGYVIDVFSNRQMESQLFRLKFLSLLERKNKCKIIDLIHTKDNKDESLTAIHMVCRKGCVDLLEFMFDQVKSVEEIEHVEVHLNELLIEACLDGKLDIVKCLLSHDAKSTGHKKAANPILSMISSYKPKLIQSLVASFEQNSIIPILRDRFNFDEMFHQNQHDFLVFDYLLDHGYDINESDEGGKFPLLQACTLGQTKLVRFLVQNGANVNKMDNDGITPLHAAAMCGFSSVVNFLLDYGVLLNVADKNGRSALWWAVEQFLPKIVAMLLDKNFDVNQDDKNGRTPLIVAIMARNIQGYNTIPIPNGNIIINRKEYMIKLLIQNGADVNKNVPLLFACEQENENIINFLLQEGADINKRCCIYGIPAITFACIRNKTSILNLLMKKGALFEHKYEALVHACAGGFFESVSLLLNNESSLIKTANKANNSIPLIAACESGHEEIINLLLKNGAFINAESYECRTALIAACSTNLRIMKLLIENGAHVNKTCKNGLNAITFAIEKTSKEIIDLLLASGANPNSEYDGCTVLMRACIFGRYDIIPSLLLNGADIHKRIRGRKWFNDIDIDGFNALSFSLYQSNTHVTELLLENGSTLNEETNYEHNPLITACVANNARVVAFLIDKGANVNKATPSGKTPLMKASKVNNTIVELLIDHFADINAYDHEGNSALIYASCQGNTDIVTYLLENGADINQENIYGATALTFACESGHLEVVVILLGNAANINKTDSLGRTPIFRASLNGHKDIISYLIQNGAHFHKKDCQGKNILMHACFYGHSSTAEFLIKNGANVNEKTINGQTALSIACSSKFMSCGIFDLLIANSAYIDKGFSLYNACKLGYSIIAKRLIESGANIDKQLHGYTPLMVACQKGHEEVVRILLEYGADVSKVNNRNDTCLSMACQVGSVGILNLLLRCSNLNLKDENAANALLFACIGEKYEIVKKMILNGTDVNNPDSTGRTALLEACSKGNLSLVQFLICHSADVNKGDRFDWTPIMEACKKGYIDIVSFLIDEGADVNDVEDSGRSCFAIACQFGYKSIIKVLKDSGSNPKQPDIKGRDSLFAAVEGGHIEIVKYLIDIGSDVNQTDYDRSTVLMEACIQGHLEMVKLLIDCGAHIDKENSKGRTALMEANRHGRNDIVKYLKLEGAIEISERIFLSLIKVIVVVLLLHLLFSTIYIDIMNINRK